jgi:hypothetical protein
MKALIFLTLFFASCSTYTSTSYYEADDRYTSINDQPIVSQDVDTVDNSTVIVNNYYDDDDFFYASRIRRFRRPLGFTYYSDYYVSPYYYTYDPYYYSWSFQPSYIWWRPSYHWNFVSYPNWYGWNSWNYYGWNNWGPSWNYYGWNNLGNVYGWNHCGWNNWHHNNWNNPVIWGPHTPIYTSFGKPVENGGKTFQNQSVAQVKESRHIPVNKYTSVPVRNSQESRVRTDVRTENRPVREVRNVETREYSRPATYKPQRETRSYSQPRTSDSRSYTQPRVSQPRNGYSQPSRSTYSQPRTSYSQPSRSTYSQPRMQSSRPSQPRMQSSRNSR